MIFSIISSYSVITSQGVVYRFRRLSTAILILDSCNLSNERYIFASGNPTFYSGTTSSLGCRSTATLQPVPSCLARSDTFVARNSSPEFEADDP